MKTNGTIYFSEVKYKVLDFIKKFIDEHDYSPTFLEIGENFSFSRARAGKICSELYKMGLINKGGSSHRKIPQWRCPSPHCARCRRRMSRQR